MSDEAGRERAMLERLALSGVVTSLAFGAGPDGVAYWSVFCAGPEGVEFERPYAARDAAHAIEVAYAECERRGWLG